MPDTFSQEELKNNLIAYGVDRKLLETCSQNRFGLRVAKSGNINAMQYLLQDPQFNDLLMFKDEDGRNIVHYAAYYGNSAMLDLLYSVPQFRAMFDETVGSQQQTIADDAAFSRSPETLNKALAYMTVPRIGTRECNLSTLDIALDSNFWLTDIQLPAMDEKTKSSIQKKLLRNKQKIQENAREAVYLKDSDEFAKFVIHHDHTVIEQFALHKKLSNNCNGLLSVALYQKSDVFLQFIEKMSDSTFYKAAFAERAKGWNTPAQAVAARQNGKAFHAFIQRLDDTTLNRAVLDKNQYHDNMLQLAARVQTDNNVFCNFIDRLNTTTINRIVLDKSKNGSPNALQTALNYQSPGAFQALILKLSSETLYQSIDDSTKSRASDTKSAQLNAIFLKFTQINACLDYDDTGDTQRHWTTLHDAFTRDATFQDIARLIATADSKHLPSPYCQLIKSLIPHYNATNKTPFTTALGIYTSYLAKRPPVETQAQELEQSIKQLINQIDSELNPLKQHSGLTLRLFYLDKIMQREETKRVAKAALTFAQSIAHTPHQTQEKFTLFEQALKDNPKWDKHTNQALNEHTQTLISRMRRFANNPSLNLMRNRSVPPQPTAAYTPPVPATVRTPVPTAVATKPVSQTTKQSQQPVAHLIPTKHPLADKAKALLAKLTQQKEELAHEIARGESAQNFLSRFYYSRKNEVKRQKLHIITLAYQLIQNRLSDNPADIAQRGQLRVDFNTALGENTDWKNGLFSQRTSELVSEVQLLMTDFLKQPPVSQPTAPANPTVEKKHTDKEIASMVLKAREKYPNMAALMKRPSLNEELRAWVTYFKEGTPAPAAQKPVDSSLELKQLTHQLGQVTVPQNSDLVKMETEYEPQRLTA